MSTSISNLGIFSVPILGLLAAVVVVAACTTTTDATRLGTKAVGSGGDDSTSGNGTSDQSTSASNGGAGGASTSSSASGTGTGGLTVPSECLSNMNCADDLDCMMGYHCNESLTPPACEKLYCGPVGSACSQEADCVTGLKCFQSVCAPMSACVMPGDPCNASSDCCGDANPEACAGGACCLTCAAILGGAGKGNPNLCEASLNAFEQVTQCAEDLCHEECTPMGQPEGIALPLSAECKMCMTQSCGADVFTNCMNN